jgi:hypothetical protein
VTATVGVDYDVKTQEATPKWQLDTSVGRAVDVRATAVGCTVSKNWDADLGAMSCNVELRGHCTWNGRVRGAPPARAVPLRAAAPARRLVPEQRARLRAPQPTVSIDVVPIHTMTKAVTGGVAFAFGKSLDVNPRIKLGKLPLKLEVGASIYKEGSADAEATSKDDVLCLRIKALNAIVQL